MKYGTEKEIKQLADAMGMTVRVRIDSEEKRLQMNPRQVEIKPPGFWGYVVNVFQSRDWDTRELLLTEIDWSTGGKNGDLSDIATTRRFCDALTLAQSIADAWNKGVK